MTLRHFAIALTVVLLAVTSSAAYERNSDGFRANNPLGSADRRAEREVPLEQIKELASECIRTYQIVSSYYLWWRSDKDTCNPRSRGHVRAAGFVRDLVDRLGHRDPVLRRCMDDMLGPHASLRDVLTSRDHRRIVRHGRTLLFEADEPFLRRDNLPDGVRASDEAPRGKPWFGVDHCSLDGSGRHSYNGRFGTLPGVLAVLAGRSLVLNEL